MFSKRIIYIGFLLFTCFLWQVNGVVYAQKKKEQRKEKKVFEESLKSKDQEQKAEAYFIEAIKYSIMEMDDKALPLFEKAVSLQPQNAAIHYKLAQTHLNLNHLPEATQFAKKSVELEPFNIYYNVQLAQIYERQNKFADAAKVYQQITERFPNVQEYYFRLAHSYLMQEKYKEALKVYNQIEKIYGLAEDVTRQKQQIYLRLNKLDEAIKEGEKLIEAYPDEPQYRILLAEIYLTNEKVNEAVPLLEQALKMSPSNAYAQLILSDIYRIQGKKELAEQELEKAFANPDLSIDNKIRIMAGYLMDFRADEKEKALKLTHLITTAHPQSARAYALHGDFLSMSGKQTAALEQYRKSIQLENNNYNVWQQMLMVMAFLNQTDSLLKYSETATELFPAQSMVWYYYGSSLLLKKEYKKAIRALEQGKNTILNDDALLVQFLSQLGDAYYNDQQYEKSYKNYESALSKEPDNAHVLNNYSYYLSLQKENLEKAKKMSEKLVEKYPNDPTYLDTHAWVLYQMGDYANALKYLEKAMENMNKNTDGTIIEHYADALYKSGKIEQAITYWQKAKEQGGELSEWIDKKITDKKLYE
jgi:tetratricopeptide (TPR) repeat protein